MLRRVGVSFAMLQLMATAVPSQTMAADQYIYCTIATDLHDTPYRESVNVVVAVAGTQKQAVVQASAGFCDRMISNSYWIGVNRMEDWDTYKRYDRLCEIEMTKDVTLVVWSDDINGSLTFGSYMCQNFGGSNAQMFAYISQADLQRYADRYSNYFDFPDDATPFS